MLIHAASARAENLPALDTAHVGETQQWSVGVLHPFTWAFNRTFEIRINHLATLVGSPNMIVRARYMSRPFTLTGEYGLSLPTPAMMLAQGHLFPTWAQAGGKIGWMLVPRVGLSATVGEQRESPFTVNVDFAWRVALTPNDAQPLDSLAPIDTLMAPALGGYRLHGGIVYDRSILWWLRARAYFDAYLYRNSQGPTGTVSLGAAIDFAIGSMSRFSLGVIWWNSQQFARDPNTNEPERSNDVYPTIDFIWAG